MRANKSDELQHRYERLEAAAAACRVARTPQERLAARQEYYQAAGGQWTEADTQRALYGPRE